MKKLITFIGFALVYNLVCWFIADGLIWLEVLLKPYTEFGKVVLTWGQHLAFIIAATLLAMKHAD